jgi:hypothetical protein
MPSLDPSAATEAVSTESTGTAPFVDHLAAGPIHVIWLPSISPTPETALNS